MLISELAQRTGLTIDTIRFYEKQGLLDETHFERGPNGYRHYTETGFQRLTLIKLGQTAGFTLNEMRQAIHAWETDQITRAEKETYMRHKLNEIEAKIRALNDMKSYITHKIEQMQVASVDESSLVTLSTP